MSPLRLRVDALDFSVDAEAAFAACFRDSPHAFWLDSSRPGDSRAHWSFLGDASGPYARVVTADVWAGTVTERSGGDTWTKQEPFFDWLAREHRRDDVDVSGVDLPFRLGWVGYLGYELKAECGGARVHRSPDPDAALLFADRMLAVDTAGGRAYLAALDDGSAEVSAWFAGMRRRLASLERSAPAVTRPSGRARLRLRHGRAAYLALVERCQDAIAAGDTYEVCLTNLAEASVDLDPWEAYRFLRRAAPAPYAGYLRFGDRTVLSTSPERFLAVSAAGVAESRPIKGTRPRGSDVAEDAGLAAELAASSKDRAENLMIVDLVRNDLARVARPGSVEVTGLFDVESYATVHQLVSTVRARLRADRSAIDCVRAAFPGGSMTGAPKLRTMEILDELEAGARGVYSGVFGWFGIDGALDLAMVIRTVVLSPGSVRYGVGGAIVADSDPAAEYEETAVKATPLLRLLDTTFPR
ncbi:MAG: aminodeoxychorismate synthase component I [Streptosporangiales bacterium]|nr:aminodeoxychorismate synthase component I [Streptosporangiales bacterium]